MKKYLLNKSQLVVISSFLLIIISIVIVSYNLTQKVLLESVRENARLITTIVNESRKLYSDEAVGRVQSHPDIKISNRYRDFEHSIPIPQTFTISLAEKLTNLNPKSGLAIRIYSKTPFKNRTDRVLDGFAMQALDHVKKMPSTPYQTMSTHNDINVFRYATPIHMKKSCVACHNVHPDSTKKDWKIGEVRGVLEVTQPLRASHANIGTIYLTRVLFIIIIILSIFAAFILLFKSYNEKKKIKQEVANQTADLREQSLTDELTGLGNRRYFNKQYDDMWRYSQRNNVSLSIAMIDIDHFKQYNDEFGHPAGDTCLLNISIGIKVGLNRPQDVIARYGGEEFVVIMIDTDINGAEKVMENIRTCVNNLKILNPSTSKSKYVSVSIGCVTIKDTHSATQSSLIEQADNALYQAKSEGRNRKVCLPFDKKM